MAATCAMPSGTAPPLLLPLQGEKVGMRGPLRELQARGETPHPDPLPARAERGSAGAARVGNAAMAREIAEIPAAAARLLARTEVIATIVARVERAKPRMVVFCGRGSSGHVGVYLRYLVEARLGLLVSNAAPSVVTAYRRPPDMRDALFVVVSQSGRSPDLVTATRVARAAGALTLAIVNDEASPAATESELVLPVGAGPEHAVAATKTVVLSMIAGARLVAALARDEDLLEGLRNLAPRLSGA